MSDEVIYDIGNRYIKLFGKIEEDNSREIIHSMQEMEIDEDRDPIDFYISCLGGCGVEIMSVRDIMKNIKCDVNTIGLGKCYSGGSLLLMSGTGERNAYKNTMILIHSLRTGLYYDSIREQESRWEHLQDLDDLVKDIMYEEMNVDSREKIDNLIERDNYMRVEEAKELGIIDEIIE